MDKALNRYCLATG